MAPAGLIAAWEDVRTHTLAVAAAMPAERYGFRPVPEAMSFAEQLRHLVGVERALRQGLATGRWSGLEGAPPGPDDRASLLDLLAREGEETRAFLRALPPAEWARPRPVPWDDVLQTADQLVLEWIVHEAHHRGQLVVYLRLCGIHPPAYA